MRRLGVVVNKRMTVQEGNLDPFTVEILDITFHNNGGSLESTMLVRETSTGELWIFTGRGTWMERHKPTEEEIALFAAQSFTLNPTDPI